ncbi:hypothetical protein NQ315_007285 [Exocentrus adspersus]|uniref:C2HC/C3H-type domain-containing protein n=1 Tax=Exocentrus adspersus TaxID=1586481 RepID=A0AAV8WD06_9CUCU|nr:hypothetical protein NQ315_007285 [Exocentrus adspersus]
MNRYLSCSLNNVVSLDLDTSWAAKELGLRYNDELRKCNARFQQRQMQEKEEKLLKLYETQQQRTFERVSSRGSAGSNTSVSSTGGGKVRQMFDERRQKAGVDRSYPLEPLKSRSGSRGGSVDRKSNVSTASRTTTVKSTVQKSVSSIKNGKPLVNKREVVHSLYNNNDGDETYEEHRYEDDLLNSNSHRRIVEMMNDHNIDDTLDNEVMPQIGFDEVDDVQPQRKSNGVAKPVQNGVVKKTGSLKSNGVALVKKETAPAARKPAKTPSPAKLALSPAKPTPSPAKPAPSPTNLTKPAPSPRSSNPVSPSKSPSSTMSSKKQDNRAPSAARLSTKQTPKSGVARDDLVECGFCGRRFATDRLQKHEDICSKTGKKKRKQYDATKHRVLGTELENYVLKQGGKGKSITSVKSKQTPKKDWRRTHEEFISAIRAAKETQAHLAKGGKLSDMPPPPPSSNPDYVQCPHCNRRFNQAAAERHIPKCANFQFNKPKPKGPNKR